MPHVTLEQIDFLTRDELFVCVTNDPPEGLLGEGVG